MNAMDKRTEHDGSMLLTKREVANELRCSPRKLDDLNARGLLPAPRRIGRSVRWSRDEIRAWVAAGCPSAEGFEQLRGAE